MTNDLRFGTVVWMKVAFTDGRNSKEAPAVVLSSDEYHAQKADFIGARITSKIHHKDTYGTVEILDIEAAGLTRPSVIKPVAFTALRSDVLKVVGQIDPKTTEHLQASLRAVFGL
jgi:mRNA interferase MazF